MLRLAQKAFYPGPIPFPLIHIDTGFKFREMIEFRDRTCREVGVRLIAHTNQEAKRDGANPFRLGTTKCCALLKTKALLDALEANGIDAAMGGARRDEEKSRAKERVFSLRDSLGTMGPQEPAAGVLESVQQPCGSRTEYARVSPVELDGDRRLGIHRSGKDSGCPSLLRQGTGNAGPRRHCSFLWTTPSTCSPERSRNGLCAGCGRWVVPIVRVQSGRPRQLCPRLSRN